MRSIFRGALARVRRGPLEGRTHRQTRGPRHAGTLVVLTAIGALPLGTHAQVANIDYPLETVRFLATTSGERAAAAAAPVILSLLQERLAAPEPAQTRTQSPTPTQVQLQLQLQTPVPTQTPASR